MKMHSTLLRPLAGAITLVTVPVLVLVLALGACAAAPLTRLHSLQALLPGDRVAGAAAAGALVVQIDTPQLPRQLDQPQWLVRRGDDSLLALEHERWSTSLADELRAALVEQLVQRYGVTDARLIAGAPPWRLSVQVVRLETVPEREVQWDSVWSLANGAGGVLLTCRSTERIAAGPGYPALAEAHRAALARLAGQIGTRLLQLQVPGTRVVCEPGV